MKLIGYNAEKLRAWVLFAEYWEDTEWKDVNSYKVEQLIGRYVPFPVPKNLNDPIIGNKFYISVREVLKPLSITSLDKNVFDMYERIKLGSPENEHCRLCKSFYSNIAGPISIEHVGCNFVNDKYKILFVGKNNWWNIESYDEQRGDGYIADTRVGILSGLTSGKSRSALIRMIGKITDGLYPENCRYEGIENVAVTNMLKCNTSSSFSAYDLTEKFIRNNCIDRCGVVKNEIEILKPKRIVFMTGKDYDKYIRSSSFKFGYSECFDGVDKKVDDKTISWTRTLLNIEKRECLFMLRTSHPQGKNESNYIGNIMNWINQTVAIENALSK